MCMRPVGKLPGPVACECEVVEDVADDVDSAKGGGEECDASFMLNCTYGLLLLMRRVVIEEFRKVIRVSK
jgi:hypothetical protein